MKYLVTRKQYYFSEVAADTEVEALELAEKLLEEDWDDDDRPDEYSIDCDPEDERCEECKLFGQCPGYYDGCFEAVNNHDKMEVS